MAAELEKSARKVNVERGLDHCIDEPSRQAKSLAEWILALLMLALSMPVILTALFLVRLTSAVGNRSAAAIRPIWAAFTMYKIRTMYQDSEPQRSPLVPAPRPPGYTVGRLSAGPIPTNCHSFSACYRAP